MIWINENENVNIIMLRDMKQRPYRSKCMKALVTKTCLYTLIARKNNYVQNFHKIDISYKFFWYNICLKELVKSYIDLF